MMELVIDLDHCRGLFDNKKLMFHSVSVLLSASVKRFSVFRMQDFYFVGAGARIPWWGFWSDVNLPLPPSSPPPQQNYIGFWGIF